MAKKKYFEILSCGHQNNLYLNGRDDEKGGTLTRTSGVCPKGDADVSVVETAYMDSSKKPTENITWSNS